MKRNVSIFEVDLPKRIVNSLYYMGRIETVGQLLEKSEEELVSIRGIGKKGIETIQEFKKNVKIDLK